MKTIKPRKIALAGTVVAAVALVGCLGCAAQTQTADTGAAQEPVQQEQTEQQAAAPEKVAKKTLAEWVTTYPNQGNSYMEAKMAHTYDAFAGASQQWLAPPVMPVRTSKRFIMSKARRFLTKTPLTTRWNGPIAPIAT